MNAAPISRLWRRIHLALAFLTIFPGPRNACSEADIVSSVPFYPLVGAVLGALLAAAAWAMHMLLPPLVAGFALVGIGAALTRGLHWDGLADVADAWGARAEGDRFWAIVKDSRIGAFGVLAMVLGVGLQGAALGHLCAAARFEPIFLAPYAGRLACLTLAYAGRPWTRPGLGSLTLRGATPPALGANLLAAGLAAWIAMPFAQLGAALFLCSLGLGFLLHLARRHQGLNGDFLGAAIVWTETAFLVCS
ncbi:MAG: cobS [Desulfomicrobiaceae bacterium]|jgi:adenosylcobinamide-GDP ribazoletransferase|nr:cobS [Desulfomicrobiaceae bacterium]MDK2872584.1 adenosylcobinamide-GDP ribazoletransferase [Desulfomicrobiaceae bacterium]